MSKFIGKIGIVKESEVRPGIYEDVPIELDYKGDIVKNYRRWDNGEHLNKGISLNSSASIIYDQALIENLMYIRYVLWNGAYWEVTTVEVDRPRVILELGGVYNGPKA